MGADVPGSGFVTTLTRRLDLGDITSRHVESQIAYLFRGKAATIWFVTPLDLYNCLICMYKMK
jgi:hypothetical protein